MTAVAEKTLPEKPVPRDVVPLWLIALTILLPTSFAMLATSATNVAIPHIAGFFGSTLDEANSACVLTPDIKGLPGIGVRTQAEFAS